MIPLPPELPGLLLGWNRDHARVLPWRSQATPYRVWIREIMPTQNRGGAVRPPPPRLLLPGGIPLSPVLPLKVAPRQKNPVRHIRQPG